MTFSALSFFSNLILWTYPAAGVFMVISGLFLYRRASLKRLPKGMGLANLRTEAERWHVPEAALVDITFSLNRFVSLFLVGAGSGILLFAVIYALLFVSPVWQQLCSFGIVSFSINIGLLFFTLAGSAGGFYALNRLRRQALASRAGGPQRHLSDYLSPLFLLCPIIFYVLLCTLVVIFHPSSISNDCLNNSSFTLSLWQGWLIYPWIGFSLLAFLLIAIVLSRFASVPSPIVPTDVPETTAIDDMFRERIVRMVQYMNLLQIIFFPASLSQAHMISYPYPLLTPLLLFAALILLISPGGLGGKLTGWFFKR